MKKTIILILGLVLMVNFAFATTNPICNYLEGELGAKEGVSLPRGMPYGNEKINFYSDSKVVGHIITKDNSIISIGCEKINDSTYDITIKSLDTIKSIVNSESQIGAFDDAISDGDITIEGKKTSKKIKAFFTRIGIKIASWFS